MHNIDRDKTTVLGRIAQLRQFACFASLSTKQAEALAKMMEEVFISKNEVIVKENDLVDAVYIIISGEAEVTRQVKKRKKVHQIAVALLREGEAIGLNDTGFYSTTGIRTASVNALTDMRLLRLELTDLYTFLKHNHLEHAMYAASAKMLRMKFIKQSLPFARLSHDRLQWLSEQVEEKKVPANTIIFKQGDKGDQCYLIRSGKVAILRMDQNGEERELAVLKSSTLFGEATLITHTPRNATARTLTDCELLVLNQKDLYELIESEDKVAKMFVSLMVDRSRPLRNPHVIMQTRKSADGQEITILKNPENDNYFKLSQEGAFVWKQLDGERTLQDITLNLTDKYQIFSPDLVAALISKLSQYGFIINIKSRKTTHKTQRPLWASLLGLIKYLLKWHFAFGDLDKWITDSYKKYIRYFFSDLGQLVLIILMLAGSSAFLYMTPTVLLFFRHHYEGFWLLLALLPYSSLEALLHELGHAYAVKAFGREVHYIGIGWYWLTPVAFTDTSDMWLASRRARMWVNFAGVYVDILVASFTAFIGFIFLSYPGVQSLLWLFALYTYIGAFRMLSPLQELDGYYILMDWVEKPKLRQSSVLWLVKKFPKCIKHPRLFRQNLPEIGYWLACISYLILITFLTLMVQDFVLQALGIHPAHPYLTLLLPFIIVFISCIGIIAEIRNQAE